MNMAEYLLYCLAVVIMIATPGPVMMLVIGAGLKGGYRRAFQTIVGTNLASLLLIACSVLILKGIFNIQAFWLDLIKLLGCVYIAYLGVDILKESRAIAGPKLEMASAVGGFRQGFLVGISNPKDILFFSAFFPQFIQVTNHFNDSLILLTASWIVLDFLTLSLLYLGFYRLTLSRGYRSVLALCGALLILIALYGLISTAGQYLF
ncbi:MULTISPECIES: LysE family translocator [Acinetobacter]|uniref:LysE family translocator n=1 Tax=Acinetobacter TaxID=469 RepID=UPI00148ACB8D|nr:LysE family translocator [Acinetobacter indicus]MCO8103851.1 LysE family translocator [Acinetobacter indicus]MDM1244840.1 LysE family translocator [Acinetobacter indicus]MDM1262225.1 LysE family translocator [Acinetobacter indicus]MDM1269556.1 LysE family translocator [Acinetobacter indicus]MDM1288893.1 LysE family translocator [Acinetobacter indicus]